MKNTYYTVVTCKCPSCGKTSVGSATKEELTKGQIKHTDCPVCRNPEVTVMDIVKD